MKRLAALREGVFASMCGYRASSDALLSGYGGVLSRPEAGQVGHERIQHRRADIRQL